MNNMTPEMKLQIKGLTAVGIIMIAAGIVIMFFLKDMSSSALMGESPQWRPNFPAIPAVDITRAPQCNAGYEKEWIGCMKLAE
jgi:hypothetical protein